MDRNEYEKLKATTKPTTLDIAWAAGVYEGEGTVRNSRGYGTGDILITQNSLWLPLRFKRLFGGTIDYEQREGSGKRYTDGVDRPVVRWRASGARARGVALTFYKFLSPYRKAQIAG